jgi:PAS domain S-box-containing protein
VVHRGNVLPNSSLDQAQPAAHASTPARPLAPRALEALQAVALGAVYFVLSWGCLTLVRHTGRVTPLWPANGVVIACLLRTDVRRWPMFLLAGLIGNIAGDIAAGDKLAQAVGLSFANSLEIVAAAGATRRLVGRHIDLTRRRDLLVFGAFGGIAAPTLSALFAMGWLKAPINDDTLFNFGAWALADGLGAAIVVPCLLSITVPALQALWAPGLRTRNLLLLALLATGMTVVFGQSQIPLGVLVFPLLLLIVFKLEFAGAAIGVLVTATVALGFELAGRGPTTFAYASPTRQVLSLQIFLAIAFFSILPVAASLARARQMKASLAASRDEAQAAQAESIEAQRWARMAEQVAGVGHFRVTASGEGSTWSDEIYRIHGLDLSQGPDLQGSLEAIHPDDIEMVMAGLKAARGEGRPFSGEYRIRRVDGAWRTVSCRTVSERDADGGVTAVIGALVDITSFKLVETAALESEARYRLLADKSSDIISRVDLDGRHSYLSPACLQVLGYAPEELVGRLVMDFTHPDDFPAIEELYERLASEGREHADQPVRYRFRARSGEWLWLETHPTVVFDRLGAPVEFVNVSHDITATMAAEAELLAAREAAEAATQAKSEFLANMSHEIRTPLTSIMGFSGLLKDIDRLPVSARAYVDRISTAGQSLLSVVNDILDFSKLEAGQVELDAQAFDPTVFLNETTELLAIQAANKGLDWDVEIDGAMPSYVLADSARLRQVLLNLLGNAIKFTAQGSVRLRGAWESDGGGRLRVSVVDTGQGIPAERRDRLFQRFSQIDGSVSRVHGGTGLGLAICKSLVELMGGEIGVRSEDGRGSTFWFTIVAPAASAAAITAPVESGSEDRETLGVARILVVDDLSVNRELVRAMLAPFGHSFEEAGNGAEAVQAALRTSFDLILMDLQMPGMDGFEAARAIRATAPLNRATPIIALSANVLPAHVLACREAGMDDHLAKPIVLTALVTKVAEWAGAEHVFGPVQVFGEAI